MTQRLFEDDNKPEIEPWQDEPAVVVEPQYESPLSPDVMPAAPEPRQYEPVPFAPESIDDSVRSSGLAWSAGIVFFSSVAFTLFLGWIADLLLGSSPWGMVGGIVLGSLIGFIQFFRLTSRIFPQNDKGPRSLMSRKDDDPDG